MGRHTENTLKERCVGVLMGLALLWAPMVAAQTVSVTSSTAGVQITTDLDVATRVLLHPTATVAVWVLEVPVPFDRSNPCPTALTNVTRSGVRLSRVSTDKDPVGWEYPAVQHWSAYGRTICAILETGSTPQTLYVSRY